MTSGHCRTIPTRVGRTFPPRRSRHGLSDHPHTRGENAWLQPSASLLSGPSPHAWGEPKSNTRVAHRRRTIPTRVGRTRWWALDSTAFPDHPHTRGENHGPDLNCHVETGPSPHAWGERAITGGFALAVRTIPTRVGRTRASPLPKSSRADHPHTRGENFQESSSADRKTGPSPHAWGERLRRTA